MRFSVLNNYYILDETTGKHLSLNEACELLNSQDKNLKKVLPGLLHPEEEVYILTKKQLCDIIEKSGD